MTIYRPGLLIICLGLGVSRQRKLSQRFASLSVTFNWCRDRIGHFHCLRPLSG
jgi:hypothetical protein